MAKTRRRLHKANQDTLVKLLKCLDEQEPLALVGSGLVIRAGYPSWGGLMQGLHDLAEIDQNWGTDRAERIRQSDDPLFRAELYRRELLGPQGSERRYHGYLSRTFGRAPKIDATLRRFVKLPFSHFLTTNYDPTLQNAYREVYSRANIKVVDWETDLIDRDEFISSLGRGRGDGTRYFTHIHGIHSNPSQIVLSDRDYLNRYVRQENAKRILFAIFAIKPVVFVGFGMNDPDLMQLLRMVAASRSAPQGRHFVVLSFNPKRDDAVLIRERLVTRYDALPIFYPEIPDHKRLEDLILALHKRQPDLLTDFTHQISEEHAAPAPPRENTVFNPDDPQKGQWGGKPQRNGRCLQAKVRTISPGWYAIYLTVVALPNSPPIDGEVRFHLHDTFPDPIIPGVIATNGRRADADVAAYGAFTVGAEVIESTTSHLELDLSKPSLVKAPKAFQDA